MITQHSITEADAIYFNHLSYQIGGFEVLQRVIKDKVKLKDLQKKYRDLVDERLMLCNLLVEKYCVSSQLFNSVKVNLKTMIMEINDENNCDK